VAAAGVGDTGASASASEDAFFTLGMDRATYVSLSLDGADQDLVALLARRNGASPNHASPSPAARPGGSFHGLSPRVRDLLVSNIALNSTACVRYDAASRAMDRSGNRTECALLEFAYRLQGRREALAGALASKPRVVAALPFTSARKLMAVAVADEAAGGGGGGGGGGGWGTVYVKGAAEIVIDRCRWGLGGAGALWAGRGRGSGSGRLWALPVWGAVCCPACKGRSIAPEAWDCGRCPTRRSLPRAPCQRPPHDSARPPASPP
jgi:magnesium-transporting ATPase (P-type)